MQTRRLAVLVMLLAPAQLLAQANCVTVVNPVPGSTVIYSYTDPFYITGHYLTNTAGSVVYISVTCSTTFTSSVSWLSPSPPSVSFSNGGGIIPGCIASGFNPYTTPRTGSCSFESFSITFTQLGNPNGTASPSPPTLSSTPDPGGRSGCASATSTDGNVWRLPLGTVHKGDSVNLTVTAHSSTPDANGNSPYTLVQDELGQQSYLIPVFEQYVPLHFDVQTDSQPFDIQITGFTGTQSADVDFCVNRPQLYPNSKKLANQKTATSLYELGVFNPDEAGPCETQAPQAYCDAERDVGLFYAILGTWFNYRAGDPPDPMFKSIFTPSPPPFQPVTPSTSIAQSQADAFNALFTAQSNAIGYAQASYVSLNRADGADVAGDQLWKSRQIQAAQRYDYALANTLVLMPKELSTLANSPHAVAVTPAAVLAFENAVASQGLPMAVSQRLTALGASSVVSDQIKKAFIVQDVSMVGGTFPAVLTSPRIITVLGNMWLAAGDLDGDGVVTCFDLSIVKAAMGQRSGQTAYDIRADVTGDGVIDIRDLAFISQRLATGTRCQ